MVDWQDTSRTPLQDVVFWKLSSLELEISVPSSSSDELHCNGNVWPWYCIMSAHPDGYSSSPSPGLTPTKSD
ncbi:hypothetical protein BJY04DRAFT_176482 [Aspergillus karnatakaensis]|uniref:uncharacterized protein n=1 Tax=Aspergillus karnatakaensis TaxID=1810916 RepID=UPI003CCCBAA7